MRSACYVQILAHVLGLLVVVGMIKSLLGTR